MNLAKEFIILSGVGDEISKGVKEKLIPSWLSFVTQFGALIVLLIVIFVFAYKPVKKMLTERANYIESNIKDAESMKANAEINEKQSQEMILASKKEASNIIQEANRQGENRKQAMIEEAHDEAERIKKQAEEDIKRSQEEALQSIRHEMVEVALSASKEILKREVNEKDDARLAEEFVNNLK